MKNLKDLTPEECVAIASLSVPSVEWKFIQSESKWNGFDLIEKDCEETLICKFIFQIDCEKNEFRLYEDLYEYHINPEIVMNYLKTLK